MENNIRRKFTKEYKLQIVRLVKDEQRKRGDIATDLGIDAAQIYRWIRMVLPHIVDTKLSHYICNITRGKRHGGSVNNSL